MARIYPPGTFDPAKDPVWTSQGEVGREADSLTWSGPLAAGATASLVFPLDVPSLARREIWYGVTFLSDGTEQRWERATWLVVQPWPAYLPMVSRAD